MKNDKAVQRTKWRIGDRWAQALAEAIQGSTLAVSYKADISAVGEHLKWPEAKVQAAINYAKAFPEEIEGALSENAATDFEALKRMLPQAVELASRGGARD